jgi:hypothetical protein
MARRERRCGKCDHFANSPNRVRHHLTNGLCRHPDAHVDGFGVFANHGCWFADHGGPDRWEPIGGRPPGEED